MIFGVASYDRGALVVLVLPTSRLTGRAAVARSRCFDGDTGRAHRNAGRPERVAAPTGREPENQTTKLRENQARPSPSPPTPSPSAPSKIRDAPRAPNYSTTSPP